MAESEKAAREAIEKEKAARQKIHEIEAKQAAEQARRITKEIRESNRRSVEAQVDSVIASVARGDLDLESGAAILRPLDPIHLVSILLQKAMR